MIKSKLMEQKRFVSIKIDASQKALLEEYYSPFSFAPTSPYIGFVADYEGIMITLYIRGKETSTYKVVFSGVDPLEEAKRWDKNATYSEPKVYEKKEWLCLQNQIGSDEVGTGDMFGPVIVCASYVSNIDIAMLKEMGIDDSKKLKDEYILEIVPILLNKIDYVQMAVDNKKYNQLIAKGYNMNSIKAVLHNACLAKLNSRHAVTNIFLDQFCLPTTYYKYLSSEKEVQKGITFHTKGESYYPSIALASCIARYSFLKKMDLLSKKYKMTFPHGAGKEADAFLEKFIAKYGVKELENVSKLNFKNYDRYKGID